jgi:hypothetical protein
VVAPETAPAETDSLRRVDLVIKYFGNESLEVLCFHELKRINASSTDLEEVEYQAFKACIAYLAQHPRVIVPPISIKGFLVLRKGQNAIISISTR